MLIIFLAWLSINNPSLSNLLENASKISEKVHGICLAALPPSSQNPQALAALLCGENITEESLHRTLVKSSLIHLFIVSGSHLIWLEEWLVFWGIPVFLRFLPTGLYCLACQWQAPIVRAWMGMGWKGIQKKCRWSLPTDIGVFWTGLLCLSFFPQWISSRSLVMGWLASLAMALASLWRIRNPLKRLFFQSTLIYLLMIPALWGFGNLHPLSILFNIVLAPLVTFLLLPLALGSCLFHSWVVVFDRVFAFFLWASRQGTEPILLESSQALPMEYLWAFLFTAHFLIHFLRLHLKRKRT